MKTTTSQKESADIARILGDFKNNIFVRSCAGSGKTRLLAAKYLTALFYFDSPRSIVAITFMEKAALELKARIHKFLNTIANANSEKELESRWDIPWTQIREALTRLDLGSFAQIQEKAKNHLQSSFNISTIHSFAKKILDTYPLETLGGIFATFDPSGRGLKEILQERSFDAMAESLSDREDFSFKKGGEILEEILKLRTLGLPRAVGVANGEGVPGDFPSLWLEFTELVDQAIAFSREEGYLDYDLILFWLYVFLEQGPPEAVQTLRSRFDYILLDELQDTDPIQFKILLSLFNQAPRSGGKFFMVGDPLQSIYGFRSTSSELGFEFALEAGFVRHDLMGNKRSGEKILKFINTVYKGLDASYEEMFPALELQGEGAVLWHPASPTAQSAQERRLEEARHAAQTVLTLSKAHAWAWKDFAVLLRKNKYGWLYQEAFREAGIPSILAGAENELIKKSLLSRELYWILKLYLNGADEQAQYRLERSFFGASFVENVADLRRLCRENVSVGVLTGKAIEMFGLESKAEELGFDETLALEDLENLAWRFSFKGLDKFLERLESYFSSKAIEDDDDKKDLSSWEGNAVKITSIHKAKGLEFPCVLIAGIADWSLRNKPNVIGWNPKTNEVFWQEPGSKTRSSKAKGGGPALSSEEDRVLYVALTRAQKTLVIFEPNLPEKSSSVKWPHQIRRALETAKANAQEFRCPLCDGLGSAQTPEKIQKRPVIVKTRHQDHRAPAPALILASRAGASMEEFEPSPLKSLLKPESAQALGGVLHRVLEKIPWKSELSFNEARDYLDSAYESEKNFSGGLEALVYEEALRIMESFFKSSFWKNDLSLKKVLAREIPVSYKNAGSLIVGRVDLLYEDAPGDLVVSDYKTRAESLEPHKEQGRHYVGALTPWAKKRGFQKIFFETISLEDLKRDRILF